MAVREPSLSFGPWAKVNSHLISYTYSIYHSREFHTEKWGVYIFEGANIRGKYSLSRNEWTVFYQNGEAKYGVPSGDFLENEKTGKKSHVATMLLLGNGGF